MDEAKNIVEHKLIIDDNLTLTIKIPIVVDAVEFMGIVARINSVIRTSGFKPNIPGIDEAPKPKKRFNELYSEEEKQALIEWRTQGAGARVLSRKFHERFGRLINPNTLKYHLVNNFDIRKGEYKGRIKKRRREAFNFSDTEVAFILRQYYINQRTAEQIGKDLKESFNVDIEWKRLYNITYGYRMRQHPLYLSIMKEKEQMDKTSEVMPNEQNNESS